MKNDNNTGYKGLFGATDISLKNLMSVSNGIKANDHTANLGEQIDPSFMINLTTDGNEVIFNNDSWGIVDRCRVAFQASNSTTVGVGKLRSRWKSI